MIDLFESEVLKPKLHTYMFKHIKKNRCKLKRGYRQQDLANNLGISISALQQFTQVSHATKPSPMFVLNFCAITGMPLSECMSNVEAITIDGGADHG